MSALEKVNFIQYIKKNVMNRNLKKRSKSPNVFKSYVGFFEPFVHLKVRNLVKFELKVMVNDEKKKFERIKYLWDLVRSYVTSLRAINRIRRLSLAN